ncbi:lysoplasmalogenase [Congregibacter variabilis]|uniref:Lysoplasmalogenase n=1 Tax=Congregibacter variabilis TaxID=3081200 RepID=A0ABZ0I6V6_9GAMM|nr:lysoplasmalogenase [Congregibacter sp. IMCC43200]
MSTLPVYIILAATLAVAAMLISDRRAPQLEWLFKPFASLCFVALALQAGALGSFYGLLLLGGLVLCLFGDILLIPSSDKTFIAGLGSFLLGHLLYAVAFLQLPFNQSAVLLSLFPVAALGILSLRWLWPHVPSNMKLPVLSYVVVICVMLLTASLSWGTSLGAWIILGAWGFAISDLSVARNQFVSPGFSNRIWGIPLYFGSQLTLAWSASLI